MPARRSPTTWSATPTSGASCATPTSGSTRPAAYAVRAALLAAVGADPLAERPGGHLTRTAADALRVEYRRLLLRLAARDLAHHLGVDDAAAELSDLAAGHPRRRAGRGPRPGGRVGGARPGSP